MEATWSLLGPDELTLLAFFPPTAPPELLLLHTPPVGGGDQAVVSEPCVVCQCGPLLSATGRQAADGGGLEHEDRRQRDRDRDTGRFCFGCAEEARSFANGTWTFDGSDRPRGLSAHVLLRLHGWRSRHVVSTTGTRFYSHWRSVLPWAPTTTGAPSALDRPRTRSVSPPGGSLESRSFQGHLCPGSASFAGLCAWDDGEIPNDCGSFIHHPFFSRFVANIMQYV